MKFLIPLVLFFGMSAFLLVGLDRDPTFVPSPLIGKPAPEFTLPVLGQEGRDFSTSDMKGKVWLLNIWATWCAACRIEHPLLVELARQNIVEIIGLNYKDQNEPAIRWLKELGDPYVATAVDQSGRVGIDWGFYGAPETFVIDKSGTVRYKHIGPVAPADLQNTILPLVAKLESDS